MQTPIEVLRRWSCCIAICCGIVATLPAAAQTDPMDHADQFYGLTDVAQVKAEEGKVTIRKTDSGDAFVRWSLNAPRAMPLTDDNDCIEVDFAAFPENGKVRVLIAIDDAAGKLHNIAWLNNHDQVGRATLPSIRQLAKDHGIDDPRSFHLFFRIGTDPKGAVTIDRIRVADKPDTTPFGEVGEKQAQPGVKELHISFGETPTEVGMSFDRGGVKPTTFQRGGGTEEAWIATDPFGKGKSWQRSFRFAINDKDFLDGGRRSIDIEVTYMLNAWGGVHVMVDTEDGPQEVANLWGDCRGKWKTQTVRLDNAHLSNAVEGSFSIKLSGDNGPLALRRVRVVGYDPKEDVRWDRMLQVAEASPIASAHEPLFVFHAGKQVGLRYTITNHADIPVAMDRQLTIRDVAESQVHQSRQTVELPARSTTPLDLTFDTTDWPLGPYTAKVDLSPASSDQGGHSFTFSTLLGVVSPTQLGKARPGEFQFGLDAGSRPSSDEGLAFYDLMGVDLLRSGVDDSRELKIGEIRSAYEKLKARGVSAMLVADPPGQMEKIDEDTRLERLAQKTAHLERLARTLAPLITYYELGNEPDLPFFYPGSIESYTDSFHQMSDAIRRGNPDAIVMNGGLCFFGEDGNRRAREFIELVDMSKLDAWAFHGHGEGGKAERDAYMRQLEATKPLGKHNVPFIDTETGMPADTPAMYLVQARTGVQKSVFAHAHDMPSLLWFRLFMGNKGYTLSHNRTEPRPTIMAYRAMVEQMRHVKFNRTLDFDQEAIEAYLFDEIDEQTQPTGRKVLVAWSNTNQRFGVSVKMDDQPGTITHASSIDLYGNTSTPALHGGVATMTIGPDPVYLTWRSAGDLSQVAAVLPALTPHHIPPVALGQTTVTRWRIANDADQPLEATLNIEVVGRIALTASNATSRLQLPATSDRIVEVSVTAEHDTSHVDLPRWWHIFPGLDATTPTTDAPIDLSRIPAQLPGADGPLPPTRGWIADNTIDLARITGGFREKQPALLFASIEAPREMKLRVGAAADWWMRWHVNGKPVYDTLESGNRGPVALSAHTFDLPLEQGHNVIAVQVLSGSAGFRLVFGGEGDIATVESGGVHPDRIEATLKTADRVLATQTLPIIYQTTLPGFAELDRDAPLADWLQREPAVVLGEGQIKNFHEAYPDQSRWYAGAADLSAVMWVRDAGQTIDIVVAVRDDADGKATNDAAAKTDILEGDALHLSIASLHSEKQPVDIQIGWHGEAPITRHHPESQGIESSVVKLAGNAEGYRYLYRATIPKALLGPSSHVRGVVVDRDGDVRKQVLQLGQLDDPQSGFRLVYTK